MNLKVVKYTDLEKYEINIDSDDLVKIYSSQLHSER